MKRLAILGSTGSIGRSALSVVDAYPDRLRVVALAAGDNADLLAAQVSRYAPRAISMAGGAAIDRLMDVRGNVIWSPYRLVDIGAELLWGERRNKDGSSGDTWRAQFAVIYRLN